MNTITVNNNNDIFHFNFNYLWLYFLSFIFWQPATGGDQLAVQQMRQAITPANKKKISDGKLSL
jgi:hypothetical protein